MGCGSCRLMGVGKGLSCRCETTTHWLPQRFTDIDWSIERPVLTRKRLFQRAYRRNVLFPSIPLMVKTRSLNLQVWKGRLEEVA